MEGESPVCTQVTQQKQRFRICSQNFWCFNIAEVLTKLWIGSQSEKFATLNSKIFVSTLLSRPVIRHAEKLQPLLKTALFLLPALWIEPLKVIILYFSIQYPVADRQSGFVECSQWTNTVYRIHESESEKHSLDFEHYYQPLRKMVCLIC